MADIVKPDHAAFVVHGTMELALTEARNIKATKVRVITLYPSITFAEATPVGYVCVPSEHACFACSQMVPYDGET